ncbi:hypothetical protein UCRPC4_g05788 [Phaeomoniella chlamydospora]|uniref:Uncharacterized protein n=1 Tax=Phaeomoniella chlamydospora TaxID=158046 RepID=A0A0G2GIQ5_PHACM|nr:hypothetical protein UCRPC4_g05788 [Phaeomoniella chlamydospora]
MSVTTTANPVTGSVLQVLTDYDIHHSGSPEEPRAAPPTNAAAPTNAQNPPDWDTEHRAVPPHRPINRELDYEERPGGLNVPEQIFIFTMLNGVGINAAVNTIWRKTGGKINDKIFRYKIGGET